MVSSNSLLGGTPNEAMLYISLPLVLASIFGWYADLNRRLHLFLLSEAIDRCSLEGWTPGIID